MKPKMTYVLLTLLAIPLANMAQSISDHSSLYFVDGFQFFKPANFNKVIGASGWKSIDHSFASGFGGYGVSKHWIYGGEGVYIQQSGSSNSKTIQANGGLGYFYAGYKVLHQSHFKIYPALGLGWGGMNVSLVNKADAKSNIGDIITTQPNASSFSIGSVLLHTTITMEYRFAKRYFIGLKSGYNFSVSGKSPWSAPNLDSNQSVKDSFGGFYTNVLIGFAIH